MDKGKIITSCQLLARQGYVFRQLENSIRFAKFNSMEIQIDIAFDQLLKVIKKLPARQLSLLKAEIEKEGKGERSPIDAEVKTTTIEVAKKKSAFSLSAGLWADYNINANELRNQAWNRTK